MAISPFTCIPRVSSQTQVTPISGRTARLREQASPKTLHALCTTGFTTHPGQGAYTKTLWRCGIKVQRHFGSLENKFQKDCNDVSAKIGIGRRARNLSPGNN